MGFNDIEWAFNVESIGSSWGVNGDLRRIYPGLRWFFLILPDNHWASSGTPGKCLVELMMETSWDYDGKFVEPWWNIAKRSMKDVMRFGSLRCFFPFFCGENGQFLAAELGTKQPNLQTNTTCSQTQWIFTGFHEVPSLFVENAPPPKNADSRRIQSPEVVLTFPKYLHIREKKTARKSIEKTWKHIL